VLDLDPGDSDSWLDAVEPACRALVAPDQLELL
jgi:hypothetical protein